MERETKLILMGICAMCISIVGVLMPQGSLIQRFLFFIHVPLLVYMAWADKLKMLFAAEVILMLGAFMGLIMVPSHLRGMILIASSFATFVYLVKIHLYQDDHYWVLCAAGLLTLTVAFSFGDVLSPLWFSIVLVAASLQMIVYALTQIIVYKFKVPWIWVGLNLIFMAKPLWYLFTL